MGFQGLAGHGMPCSAPWTAHTNRLFPLKQLFRLRPHDGSQHRKHPFLVAAALKAVVPLLQQAQSLVLIDPANSLLVELLKPLDVAIRLG